MQLQIKNCSSVLAVDSLHEKIARKVIIMHGSGGCTVAKIENSHLYAYPHEAELSHSGPWLQWKGLWDAAEETENQRHESNGDFPHAHFFPLVFWPAVKILFAVHAVQSTQTQGDKYCLWEGFIPFVPV